MFKMRRFNERRFSALVDIKVIWGTLKQMIWSLSQVHYIRIAKDGSRASLVFKTPQVILLCHLVVKPCTSCSPRAMWLP